GVVEQGGGETQVAAAGVAGGRGDAGGGAAETLDVAAGQLDRRVLPQVGGVAVEPAEVALVDRLDVVADRAVVAVGVPGPLQGGRQLHGLGDLGAGHAAVQHAQGLVVQIGVQVALLRQEGDDALAAPGRPVVGGEGHVGAVGEQGDRLGQVAGPEAGVADHGAAQGQDVVQVVGGVLGHAQGAPVG